MATLLIHVISDFLRDQGTQANLFGEAFRCAVLEDETTALTNYGCSPAQIQLLLKRDRNQFLAAVSKEIGAVMDELDTTLGMNLNYPGGSVRLKQAKVLFSTGNARNIEIRGDGLAGVLTVTFVKGAVTTPGVVVGRTCDKDVWQRVYVTANLAAGNYIATVASAGNGTQDAIPLTVP
jgi:hypothetical protein